MIYYKISPDPSLPKRGKEKENFTKERERKGRNDPLDYAKRVKLFGQSDQNQTHSKNQGPSHPGLPLAFFKKKNSHPCAKEGAHLAEGHHITHLAHR